MWMNIRCDVRDMILFSICVCFFYYYSNLMWNLVGKWKRDINQMDVYNLLIEYLELEFNLRLYLDEHIYICV